jgi:hypothetical protein
LRFAVCKLSIANCPFASCCLICGQDCFHVLMSNHYMPVSNSLGEYINARYLTSKNVSASTGL